MPQQMQQRSFLESPLYQQMLARTLAQGQPQSQYPKQAIANTLAQLVNAYTLKNAVNAGEERQAKMAEEIAGLWSNPGGMAPNADPSMASQAGASSMAIPDKNTILARLLASKNPDIQGMVAPKMIESALSALDPEEAYTLSEGAARFQGSNKIAENKKPENYNQPFLSDGSENPAFQSWKLRERTAGRPSTTVNVSTDSLASGIGKGASDILQTSNAAASGAASTIVQGNGILAALDSGKAMTGPGTSASVTVKQIFGGNPEQLARTREVIKGLAEVTLQSRAMLRGSGTVSDNEQKLLERARSGSIDDMTDAEIRAVVSVNNRLSRQVIREHKTKVEKAAKSVPGAASVLPIFEVAEPEEYKPSNIPVVNW